METPNELWGKDLGMNRVRMTASTYCGMLFFSQNRFIWIILVLSGVILVLILVLSNKKNHGRTTSPCKWSPAHPLYSPRSKSAAYFLFGVGARYFQNCKTSRNSSFSAPEELIFRRLAEATKYILHPNGKGSPPHITTDGIGFNFPAKKSVAETQTVCSR